MDKFANKPETERHDLLQEAANRRDVAPIIIEKDFWVCWTLKRLFTDPALAPHLTFKGGTSLSKAYGLIERFSEDIDLTISREAPLLKEGASPMEENISGKERERRIDTLKQNAQRFVAEIILPNLQGSIAAQLGNAQSWQLMLDKNDPDQQTILFHFPKTFNYGMGYGRGAYGVGNFGEGETGYIKPSIKLEFGARGETEPHTQSTLRAYVAETFSDLLPDATFDVSTLAAERSFWEKVTILHALYHNQKLASRMSRHYYDTCMMAQRGVADTALRDRALLEQVVRNKKLLFRDAKASYDTAVFGTLRLVPPEELLPSLKKDYEAMGEMFMGTAPDFAEILSELAELEGKINAHAG
ncbi:MAG: nucleotidyl transferase AbiEii/AbiGii toxin family protein [Alphaproteobacteria bacterium]|nr:nucleotidyl transferase AbiEii/AbiGii toxin family protein [Alphaproteobacteria bacterium]